MTSAEAAMAKIVTVLRSERVFMTLPIHHGSERASGKRAADEISERPDPLPGAG